MAKTRYKYPLNESEYQATIVFTTIQKKESGTASAEQIKGLAKLEARKTQLLDAKRDNSTGASTKQNAGDELETINAEIRELYGQAQPRTSNEITLADTSVSLYLPQGIQIRDNVSYENFDLGKSGALVEGGANIASAMLQDGLGSFVDAMKAPTGSQAAKLAMVTAASQLGAQEIGGALRLSAGVTVNPNSRTLFKQSNIREFSFSFKMIAKSKQEAEQIQQIIKHFRTELYPKNILVGNVSLGYEFPNQFQIEMLYKGKQIPGIGKIRPCYLRDVNTTYNANSMAFHEDGNVLEVEVSMSFQEDKALTREDVEAGY